MCSCQSKTQTKWQISCAPFYLPCQTSELTLQQKQWSMHCRNVSLQFRHLHPTSKTTCSYHLSSGTRLQSYCRLLCVDGVQDSLSRSFHKWWREGLSFCKTTPAYTLDSIVPQKSAKVGQQTRNLCPCWCGNNKETKKNGFWTCQKCLRGSTASMGKKALKQGNHEGRHSHSSSKQGQPKRNIVKRDTFRR